MSCGAGGKELLFDFETNTLREYGKLPNIPVGMVGITLSPDEKTLGLVQQHYDGSDLWLVDHFE